MDLSSGHIYVYQPWFAKAIVPFCMAWPFVAFVYLRKGGRSSAPIAAMLVALALAAAGTWLHFSDIIGAMAISGGGRGATAAGMAEAFAMLGVGGWSAVFVGVVALILRHRPVADRGVVCVAALWIADVIAALLFTPRPQDRVLVYAGAIVSLAIAVAAAIWLFLVARGRVAPRPVPYAIGAMAMACIGTGFFVWQRVQDYVAIAMHG